MTEAENAAGDQVGEQQILEYVRLARDIFPEEVDGTTPTIDAGQPLFNAIGGPLGEPAGSEPVDFEHEIIALAHRIIQRDGLVLPSADTSLQGTTSDDQPRYPSIPMDRETEHAMIWRTTESTAEALGPTVPHGDRKAFRHTPTTYDNDLEPILPPGMNREIVEWINRLVMNMIASQPRLAKDLPALPTSDSQDRKPVVKTSKPMGLHWSDVLSALAVDAESPADQELSRRVAERVKERFANPTPSGSEPVESRTEPCPEDDRISTLLSRHATLERSLKRRQALEAALYDDDGSQESKPKADRKRNKATSGHA